MMNMIEFIEQIIAAMAVSWFWFLFILFMGYPIYIWLVGVISFFIARFREASIPQKIAQVVIIHVPIMGFILFIIASWWR